MDKSLAVLILEDLPDDVTLIERELKRANIIFTSLIVDQKTEFESALHEFNPDVVLADHSLPQFNSIEALSLCQESRKKSGVSIPFIIITGNVSEDFAIQALKAGVDDYILKDRLKRLPMAIERAMEKCRIQNERLKYLDQIIAKDAFNK